MLIECAGQRVPGTIILASGNGRSLMLGFDALLDGCVGMMPVWQDEAGTYRALMTGKEVAVTRQGDA